MKTNLMKSILHLKEDTEYQIPLREGGIEKDNKEIGRAKAGVAPATQAGVKRTKVNAEAQQDSETSKEEVKQVKATATQSQGELPDAQKSKNDKTDQSEADSEAAKEAKKKTDEISQEEVDLKNLEKDLEETQNQEQSNTEENNNNTTTETAPQVDSAKAALDEMKKLASQEGVIHPSLFISNFSKILGLMERAMQLQVKESGSATEESGSVTKEEAPKATEPATEQTETLEKTEVPEQTETPAEGK